MDASHLFIGAAGFVLTAETFIVSGASIQFPLCFLVGFATVVFYGIHRLFQIKTYADIPSKRLSMLTQHKSIVIASVVVSMMLCIILIIIYYFNHWVIWLLLGVGALLYLLPWLKHEKRIRDLDFVKIGMIGLAWSAITVGLPYLIYEVGAELMPGSFIERFLFFLLITLPFDIRDQSEDERLGIKTLATVLSPLQFKGLGILLFCSVSLVLWCSFFSFVYALSLQIVSIIGLICLLLANERRPLWFYSFVLDGLIMGRLILYFVFLALLD